MSPERARRVLGASCLCGLAALGLMTWQVFDPSVVPVIVAMSVGQVLGTASFTAYLFVVLADLRARRSESGDGGRRGVRDSPLR